MKQFDTIEKEKPKKPEPEGLKWFLIRTQQWKEQVAFKAIKADLWPVYLPQCLVDRRHARRIEKVSRPLFPRYLFVQFDRVVDTERYGSLNHYRGVQARGLMCGRDGKPLACPDEVVDSIKAHERSMMLEAGEEKTGYKPGDILLAQIGPWATMVLKYS